MSAQWDVSTGPLIRPLSCSLARSAHQDDDFIPEKEWLHERRKTNERPVNDRNSGTIDERRRFASPG